MGASVETGREKAGHRHVARSIGEEGQMYDSMVAVRAPKSPRRDVAVGASLREYDRAMNNDPKTGTFLGMPYDWRKPTVARAKQRLWNPDEPRLFVPRVFGMGWDVNFARLLGRKPKP
jgi:hypothetical protein